jgi:hypothetical protein
MHTKINKYNNGIPVFQSPVENVTIRYLKSEDKIWMILSNRNAESKVIEFESFKGTASIVYGDNDIDLLSAGKIGLKANATMVLELEDKR